MFCAVCGKCCDSPARFCKSCGTDLTRISAAVSGEYEKSELSKIEERYWRRTLTGGMGSLVAVLAILWIITFAVGKIESDAFLPFTLVLTWIAAMILSLNWVIARHKRKIERALANRASLGARREEGDRLLESPPQSERVNSGLSVTEQTTELLAEPRRERGAPEDVTRR